MVIRGFTYSKTSTFRERFARGWVSNPVNTPDGQPRHPGWEHQATKTITEVNLYEHQNPQCPDVSGRVALERDTNGTSRLTANVLAGRSYTLQASEHLTNRTDLTTQSATPNRIEFTDAATNAPPKRFYRVKQN
jgi:hypothetical protein